jgi:hypothetical protein
LRHSPSKTGVNAPDGSIRATKAERAQTDNQRQRAAEAFLAWLRELDLLAPARSARPRHGTH